MKTLFAAILFMAFLPKDIYSQTGLSEAEKSALISLRQEEKVARDFYAQMYEAHGINSFRSISKSEERHMELVGQLLEKYKFEDPLRDGYDVPGKFRNQKFGDLYSDLLRKGSKSVNDALFAAAEFEEVDIADINRMTREISDQYIVEVFGRLKSASQNHLRAIVRNLSARGLKYEPVVLGKEEYEGIISGKDY